MIVENGWLIFLCRRTQYTLQTLMFLGFLPPGHETSYTRPQAIPPGSVRSCSFAKDGRDQGVKGRIAHLEAIKLPNEQSHGGTGIRIATG
eukprot:9038758-Pyramimonas_sp.AAC.1